jgi:SNF2 family DNA or RNA helicase
MFAKNTPIIVAQESTKIHGGILADACGLRKTLSALNKISVKLV